ncbi:hypothetical protein SEA_ROBINSPARKLES_107 [Gordonia phage RobinSparkles]|nr:hypothetical protein SEA_ROBINSPARKLES_107 [Gordonia phage RobinSparkles]
MEIKEYKLLDEIEDAQDRVRQDKQLGYSAVILALLSWSGFTFGITTEAHEIISNGAGVGLSIPSFLLGLIFTAVACAFMFGMLGDDKAELKKARRAHRDYQIKYLEEQTKSNGEI